MLIRHKRNVEKQRNGTVFSFTDLGYCSAACVTDLGGLLFCCVRHGLRGCSSAACVTDLGGCSSAACVTDLGAAPLQRASRT